MLMIRRLMIAATMVALLGSAAQANDAGDPDQSCDGSTPVTG